MTDAVSKRPVEVRSHDPNWPYILIPYEQLPEVRQLLDRHSIRYEVDEETISINDGPEEIYIDLAHGTDARFVQSLLDKAR